MFFRFAYAEVLYILLPLFIVIMFYRWRWHKSPRYCFPLADNLKREGQLKNTYHKKIFFLLRAISLFGLALLVARPQMVDEKSMINVDGVDIVLTLDVSGSMQCIDDIKDRRTRFQVAQHEAIRFVEKRVNDPIGLVIFAHDVFSHCPLTLDKHFLKEIIGAMQLGIINPHGTFLGTGLATAVNRLKNSKAKSKIVILLTDGEPTPPEKIDVDTAIDLAKKCGVKVYVIGIGNEKGAYIQHPIFGLQQVQQVLFNKALLTKIAQQTGGQFFHAHSPSDMRSIYDKIDTLETTSYETNIFHNYYELFLSFIWVILLLIGLEFFLRLFIWRGIF